MNSFPLNEKAPFSTTFVELTFKKVKASSIRSFCFLFANGCFVLNTHFNVDIKAVKNHPPPKWPRWRRCVKTNSFWMAYSWYMYDIVFFSTHRTPHQRFIWCWAGHKKPLITLVDPEHRRLKNPPGAIRGSNRNWSHLIFAPWSHRSQHNTQRLEVLDGQVLALAPVLPQLQRG